MRVRRSLSPGKVFFESEGSLKKIGIEDIPRVIRLKSEGYARVCGIMHQWGVSNSPIFVDNVRFPIRFANPPTVVAQGGDVTISNITVDGFRIATFENSVAWLAIDPTS